MCDTMRDDSFPRNLDGEDLDLYCNTIDFELHKLLEPITRRFYTAEGPVEKDRFDRPHHEATLDTSTIPSPDQREAFELMVKLLSWANSFAGVLRYDVCVSHKGCEYHDEHARKMVARCKEDVVGSPLTTTTD